MTGTRRFAAAEPTSRSRRPDGRAQDLVRARDPRRGLAQRRAAEPARRPAHPRLDAPRSRWTTSPRRLLVIGGGIIGLEMAAVYHALGREVTVVELLPDAARRASTPTSCGRSSGGSRSAMRASISGREVSEVRAEPAGLRVRFEGPNAPAEGVFDRVLVAVGRRPNGDGSAPSAPACASTSAASCRSTRSSAPTSRTSTRSAICAARRCSRTRRCTRARSRPR